MATKNQHFVPRVYLKAWETQVETHKEPEKKFQGVYRFRETTDSGEGANVRSIMWEPHLYTIRFGDRSISKMCPKIYGYFAKEVFREMRRGGDKPIYAKYGSSFIRTKESVRKHLYEVQNWEFYYENGNVAAGRRVLNRFNNINCYLLEEEFDKRFEDNWEGLYHDFVNEVKCSKLLSLGSSERVISKRTALDMLSFFLTMLCRNPNFSALGIYTRLKESTLYPAFEKLAEEAMREENKDCTKEEIDGERKEARKYIDEIFRGVWFAELYRLMFKTTGGFCHELCELALKGCQMILFETYDDAPHFITSDNPAFENISNIKRENDNGLIFPLSPRYLLMITKGDEGINVVDYRMASADVVKHFNGIIANNRKSLIVADTRRIVV